MTNKEIFIWENGKKVGKYVITNPSQKAMKWIDSSSKWVKELEDGRLEVGGTRRGDCFGGVRDFKGSAIIPSKKWRKLFLTTKFVIKHEGYFSAKTKYTESEFRTSDATNEGIKKYNTIQDAVEEKVRLAKFLIKQNSMCKGLNTDIDVELAKIEIVELKVWIEIEGESND